MSIITIFNSHNKNDSIIIRALPKTEHIFDWTSLQTAAYYNFDYNAVKCKLIKNGIHIGTKPDYFSLEHFNCIRFDENRKVLRVHNIHITLYTENEIINEPPIMVISFYICNPIKRFFNKFISN